MYKLKHNKRSNLKQQAMALMEQYNLRLIIIDLVNARQEGLQLASWVQKRAPSVPVILIVPSANTQAFPNNQFCTLVQPFSLYEFIECSKTVLAKAKANNALQQAHVSQPFLSNSIETPWQKL